MSYVDIKNVGVVDLTTTQVTPAQDESVILLRRLLQLAQTLGVTDSSQRQKVTIDAITGNLTLQNIVAVNSVTNIAGLGGVDPRYQFLDSARNDYSVSIRAKLIN